MLFQWTSSFVAGVVIGFIYDWRLTLVMLGTAPFLVASAAYFVKVILHNIPYSGKIGG